MNGPSHRVHVGEWSKSGSAAHQGAQRPRSNWQSRPPDDHEPCGQQMQNSENGCKRSSHADTKESADSTGLMPVEQRTHVTRGFLPQTSRGRSV